MVFPGKASDLRGLMSPPDIGHPGSNQLKAFTLSLSFLPLKDPANYLESNNKDGYGKPFSDSESEHVSARFRIHPRPGSLTLKMPFRLVARVSSKMIRRRSMASVAYV